MFFIASIIIIHVAVYYLGKKVRMTKNGLNDFNQSWAIDMKKWKLQLEIYGEEKKGASYTLLDP
jgi:hypothetical protein